MRKRLSLSLLVVLALAASLSGQAAAPAVPPRSGPPATRVEAVRETIHGVEVADPYRWLEDQDAPATRAWIADQNRYAEAYLSRIPGRDRLAKRIGELLKVDVYGLPSVRGGRYFFTKRLADQDQSVLYVRQSALAKDEVLVDPHPMSPSHTTSVNFLDVTTDGRFAAYAVRQGGEDEVTVHFLDVDGRKERADVLPRARYAGVSIEKDHGGVFYAKHTPEGPRVYHHVFGSDAARDTKLFGDGYGPEKFIGVSLSEDGKYLLISVSHGSAAKKTEIYVQNLAAGGPILPIVNDVDSPFSASFAGDRLYLETNWEAPRGRVLSVDLANPAREKWATVVPESAATIRSVSAVGGKLFVDYLDNVVSRVKVFDAAGKPEREISFPTLGSVGAMRGTWKGAEAFFSFSSYATPTTIYRYDVGHGTQSVWARPRVPIDSDRFEVRQVRFASRDGTQIPMFLVHRKGLALDGNNPAYLTGYGGFRLSQTPTFSARAVLWAENGGVLAVPNLRGGGEFGEEWHRAGMLGKKQNVFDDFIAAAEWLVANRYTRPEKLAIGGGSNGGLLVGAALTQRPELFAAVVCSYPLLDMVRYHRFLVARFWVPEYGSAENAEEFPALLAYSPYHHVQTGGKYPAVLFITGDSDTRVAPLHARKMTALLQSATSSERPVLLHYDTKAGHSGGLPVSKQIEDLTDELSFAFSQVGVKPR